MGRSSKEQSEQNRILIVEKASELFRARGVNDVSVSDVMKAAGMTIGGFYKHFDSKEALTEEAARLAFKNSCLGWETLGAGRGENLQRTIAEHYFVPKEGSTRCPMMAFGGDLMKHEHPGLTADCARGIRALLSVFVSGDSGDREVTDDSKKLALFAAMVGANYLSEVSGDVELSAKLRSAVLEMF
ncbi:MULTISPECIES: TetR/AcrR family transcriptional regulator [Erwiniaceae]|uniref:TetR/AcrR family transcriptional regulator n=1 Tax=Erwiniaceae TaxID=1903409 RepID=UPI00190A4EBE|nr:MULTISPECIES: TetR/AcrR family transcriptional regulator [Erwiniaceae]MBK0090007.1 TetR/AcrR family transcriptional regulator [Erwinia sp. S59]MBK0126327.1 TetR/AcrR family transcriptional regulator [Pantoea sp. S61]